MRRDVYEGEVKRLTRIYLKIGDSAKCFPSINLRMTSNNSIRETNMGKGEQHELHRRPALPNRDSTYTDDPFQGTDYPIAEPEKKPLSPQRQDSQASLTGHEDVEDAEAGLPLVDTTVAIPEKAAQPPTPRTRTRKAWIWATYMLTFWVPMPLIKGCLNLQRPDVRLAWREKVALCILIALSWCFMGFLIIGVSRTLCPPKRLLSQGEIDGLKTLDKPFVTIYNSYYRIDDIVKDHVDLNGYLNNQAMEDAVLGRDMSLLFYKTPNWEKYCPGLTQPSGWDNLKRVIPDKYDKVWYPHQKSDVDYLDKIKKMRRGTVARDKGWIDQYLSEDTQAHKIIVIDGHVYDVSTYLDASNDVDFLGPNFRAIIEQYGPGGKDVTSLMAQVIKAEGKQKYNAYRNCLQGMMDIGVIDDRNSPQCQIANMVLLAASIILGAVVLMKFIAALQFGTTPAPVQKDKLVILQVPCYTEGSESLQRTFESLATCLYPDKQKLIFVVCDGIIVGQGNDDHTPAFVLDILCGNKQLSPEKFAFQSLGDGGKQLNYAQVYCGMYAAKGHDVPYLVVVKCGNDREQSRPGNRGKRDSQLILMRFLHNVHYNKPMSPLELEIYRQMVHIIGVHPSVYEYTLMVDADTTIMPEALNRMISKMTLDGRIIGLCGETLLSNANKNITTMIQVYEYFISHHLAKAFESLFGSVTCLPGCFCMYRIKADPEKKQRPYLIAPAIIREYSENNVDTLHKKNLLSLGEDRYLTTLMMRTFPDCELKFIRDAKCLTNAPEAWGVLLSQRRRWINSTVHNLLELVMIKNLCGFCCFSMRFIVLIDLVATIVQPASIGYMVYLIWLYAGDGVTEIKQVPIVTLVMFAAIYGLQIILFILKRKWEHIVWMLFYLLAFVVYALILPIYAFWHFDDFSWGNTRVVTDADGNPIKVVNIDGEFDASDVPLKTWEAYSAELEDQAERASSYHPMESAYAAGSVYNDGVVPAYPGSAYGSAYGGVDPAAQGLHGGAHTPTVYNDDVRSQPRSVGGPQYPRPMHQYQSPRGSEYGGQGSVYGAAPFPAGSLHGGYGTGESLYNGGSVYGGGAAPPLPTGQQIPGDGELKRELREMLQNADLATVTKRQLYTQLLDRFSAQNGYDEGSVRTRKAWIYTQVEKMVERQGQGEGGSEHS